MNLLNPHISNLKPRFSLFSDISDKQQNFGNSCVQANNIKCIESVDYIINKIGELIKLSEEVDLPESFSEESFKENTLRTFEHHNILMGSLFDLFFQFQNFKFFYQAGVSQINSTDFLKKKFEDTYNQFNFYILSSSDPRFTEAFTSYWNSFIKPVQTIILKENDKSHFLRRLNDFNLRWNILNVELTKRNKKVSTPVATLLNTMHNRWKIILRLTLR